MYGDTDSSHRPPQSAADYSGEDIFLCCTHCLVTVIGKDHDSLSSWWTFNEALFMLQPQRERAEKCRAGPSRRAVRGWKHFEVRERLRGLITRLCCHSRQPANRSEKKSKAKPGFTFPTPPPPTPPPQSIQNIRETPLCLLTVKCIVLFLTARLAWRSQTPGRTIWSSCPSSVVLCFLLLIASRAFSFISCFTLSSRLRVPSHALHFLPSFLPWRSATPWLVSPVPR